jgi:hypothetical protein
MVITTRRILKKRTARYLSQLMDNKVRTYDMDKTLLEYIAMLKPRKRRFRLFWIKIYCQDLSHIRGGLLNWAYSSSPTRRQAV